MKILFLLVARGGSKGIKHKNLSKIGNRTLIALKTLGCLKSKFCDEVIISTDDKKIAEEAIKNGAKQYFWRPDKYSSDDSSINDVISHALKELEFNFNKIYDYIMLLEPSSPFTRPKDYDIAISIMKEKKQTK